MITIRDAGGRISRKVSAIDEIAFSNSILALQAALSAAQTGKSPQESGMAADADLKLFCKR